MVPLIIPAALLLAGLAPAVSPHLGRGGAPREITPTPRS